MIRLDDIRVRPEPSDLADRSGLPLAEAASFLKSVGELECAAVYDEMEPAELPGANLDAEKAVAALIAATGSDPESHPAGRAAAALALAETLELLEYHVRRYLKPTGLVPQGRLIPGCPELALSAETAVFNHFRPDNTLGLCLDAAGRIDPGRGLAVVFPAGTSPRTPSRCDLCARRDCPSRIIAE